MTPANLYRIARFFIAGGIATATNLCILYTLIYFLHFWYVSASVVAFLGSFVVSFALQKFWTFRDQNREQTRRQALIYLVIVLGNLVVNTGLVYAFVAYLHLPPLVAQLVAAALIACESFFAYRVFVFGRNEIQTGEIITRSEL